ncbi:MAG: hypothetical protein AAFQ79_04540 [Pseudomonadota bacterium]
MALAPSSLADKSLGLCRLAASAVIAGVARHLTVKDVNDRIAGKPLRDQVIVLGGVMLALFLAAVFAAQFGIIGMLVYFLSLIILVN